MKKLFGLIVLVQASLFCITSCKKNETNTGNSEKKDSEIMTGFLNKLSPATETFTVNASKGGFVSTAKNSKYYFPSNSFVNSLGQPVSGDVTVNIREITSVDEMILADKPTVASDGNMLVSYGEYFVKASQNNQALTLKGDSGIRAQVLGMSNVQKIPMWSGDSSMETKFSGYDYLDRFVTVSTAVPVNRGISWNQLVNSTALANAPYINFPIDSLNRWRNCDLFIYDTRPKTTVFCYFADHFNRATSISSQGIQPTMLYFKPKGFNSLVKLYDLILNPVPGKEGFYSVRSSIPIGLEGTFLAMSVVDGVFYAETKNVIIAAPEAGKSFSSFTFSPHAVSEAELTALIRNMTIR